MIHFNRMHGLTKPLALALFLLLLVMIIPLTTPAQKSRAAGPSCTGDWTLSFDSNTVTWTFNEDGTITAQDDTTNINGGTWTPPNGTDISFTTTESTSTSQTTWQGTINGTSASGTYGDGQNAWSATVPAGCAASTTTEQSMATPMSDQQDQGNLAQAVTCSDGTTRSADQITTFFQNITQDNLPTGTSLNDAKNDPCSIIPPISDIASVGSTQVADDTIDNSQDKGSKSSSVVKCAEAYYYVGGPWRDTFYINPSQIPILQQSSWWNIQAFRPSTTNSPEISPLLIHLNNRCQIFSVDSSLNETPINDLGRVVLAGIPNGKGGLLYDQKNHVLIILNSDLEIRGDWSSDHTPVWVQAQSHKYGYVDNINRTTLGSDHLLTATNVHQADPSTSPDYSNAAALCILNFVNGMFWTKSVPLSTAGCVGGTLNGVYIEASVPQKEMSLSEWQRFFYNK